jgi:hypothetical protein
MSTSHAGFGRSTKAGTVAAGPGLGITYHNERIWSYLALKRAVKPATETSIHGLFFTIAFIGCI